MKIYSSLYLLGALGVLTATSAVSAAVDTSQWKCEACPFPKSTSGTVDVGLGAVSDESAKFGDFTGLQRKGAHLVLGGAVSRRGDDGYYADLTAADLGLGTRSLAAQSGREGLYSLRLGYAEVPRHLSNSAATPFLGVGGNALTLPSSPPGFPAVNTAAMPLASTLQPVDLGYKNKRFDLGATWIAGEAWSYRVNVRHDVRDGTKPSSGSFFSTASQFVAPVDQVTDELEVSASYATRQLQATLGYQISMFRNDHAGLTWANPFTPLVAGADSGQLALAPDNQVHQVVGSAGYDITPKIRASADFAVGRMTQDAAYVDPTQNTSLPVTRVDLPTQSLAGRANTFNGSVRFTAAPLDGLRLNASYTRDRRDNRTPIQSYPVVTTDWFVNPLQRSNTPLSITQDRFKLGGDYRGPGSWRFSAGAEQDQRQRSYQEVATTRETTVWGRVGVQPREDLSLSLKLAHAGRSNSAYGTSTWFGYAENPLLRKYNLADRQRETAGVRADISIGEKVSVGLSADIANDDYDKSVIGLNSARSVNVGADVSVAISEQTQAHLFAQGERIRSRQTGSAAFGSPDWTARNKDGFEVFGLGVKHKAIPGKLDIGGDLTVSRSRNDVSIDAGPNDPPFPTITAKVDSLKLYATYKLQDNLSLTGSYWYELYESQDWRLDGVLPDTVGNLLSFGDQPARYRVNVLRLGLRYRF